MIMFAPFADQDMFYMKVNVLQDVQKASWDMKINAQDVLETVVNAFSLDMENYV